MSSQYETKILPRLPTSDLLNPVPTIPPTNADIEPLNQAESGEFA